MVGEGAVVSLEAQLAPLVVRQICSHGRNGLLLLGEVDLLVAIPELVPASVSLGPSAALVGVRLKRTRLLLVLSLLLAP